jgi:hypothetical protein
MHHLRVSVVCNNERSVREHGGSPFLREGVVPGTSDAHNVRGSNFLVCLTYAQEIEP